MRSEASTFSCLLYVGSLSDAGGRSIVSGSNKAVSTSTQGQTCNLEKEFSQEVS